MKRLAYFLAVAFCMTAMGSVARAQVPILYYDFENNATRTTFENLVEQAVNGGSGAFSITTPASPTPTGVAGAGGFRNADDAATNGTALSTGSSPNWASAVTADPGTGATAYYQFVVNTSGFSGMSIEFDSRASSTGPCRLGILYSTDGTTFTSAGILQNSGFSATSPTDVTSWATNVFDLSSITAIDNQASVTIRIYAFAGTAGERTANNSMGTAATTGTFRVDNVSVRAKTATASKTLLDYPAIGLSLKSGVVFTPTYSDFAVNGSGITVTLASNLTLNGILTLTSGIISTGANTLTIGSSGSISGASPTNYVIGNLNKIYSATGVKGFEVGTANGYSPVSVNITAGTFPTDFTVKAVQGPQPNIMTSGGALQRYWQLAATGVTANLIFNYLDIDIPAPASSEDTFVIFKWDGSFTTPGGSVNTGTNEASISGVSDATLLSDWTLAQPNAPTAADGLVSGYILNNAGTPVEGAVVNLSGGQNRKTITNANGYYQFDKVEATGFYTVTPWRVNYTFGPVNRSFSLLGNKTDATFTGTANGDHLNPLDTPEYFVRQQYVDVLGREPDEGGFNYWSDEILLCGSDAACVNARRREVAAAFFIEQEFQATGSYIYDMYKGSLGRQPVFSEYIIDRKQVIGGPDLATQKTAFADGFVGRTEFVQKYQGYNSAESFVDALLQNVQQSSQVDLGSRRNALINQYTAGGSQNQSRSLVLRALADDALLKEAEYDAAFVLTEYFGYLRRNPEPEGYAFWLNVLNHGDVGNYRGMVCSFITSTEYQQRFSSVVSHSNAECGQ